MWANAYNIFMIKIIFNLIVDFVQSDDSDISFCVIHNALKIFDNNFQGIVPKLPYFSNWKR